MVFDPPTGTVTFLFTDIEGSTRIWERSPEAMQSALARHDKILQDVIESHGGFVFKTIGDAFCAAFTYAPDALGAALAAQRALAGEPWHETGPLRVRMALHTGAAEERGGDYFGPPLNRVARLLSAGHGGQVLLSLSAQELARDSLPEGVRLEDLGEQRLKDLFRPERVFQLTAPDLPAEFPPLRTLEARRNNLPTQPTPLIGREREVAEVCELLGRAETRLLTLTGPGGTGKTRLALQAAADLLDDFPGGAFFVPLAAVTDPELFFPTLARALGVRETGDGTLEESLKEHLRDKKLLLVLDNFEQVLEAASAVAGLLEAPGAKVLATSRTPLGLYGEREYAVPPLSLPDPERLPDDLAALSQYEAVRLFIECAQASKAGFEVTTENAPAVAEICVRLDGLPLAIELAAARIKLLPPQAMLKRLGNRMKLLTGGARDLPERQRTLRGAIEWSHDLLNEGERKLFARLSVFAGGRTLEAIEAVCDPEGDLPVDVLDGTSSLLDKSLLRQEEGPEGEPRFVMLETIHEFAREKLEESGEAEEVGRLHAGYFLALAEEAEPKLVGPDQVDWLDRLEAEHDNLRAALSWALGGGDAALGLRLAGALAWYWMVRVHLSEGCSWLEEGLAKGSTATAAARAKALWGLGVISQEQGELDRSRASSEVALALYRELGDDRGIASSLVTVGWAQMLGGEPERAAESTEEAVAAARESGDEWSLSDALNGLATALLNLGDYERAEALWEEALALGRKQQDPRRIAAILYNTGYAALCRGDHERATELLEGALAVGRELKEVSSVAMSTMSLGIAAALRKDHERATELLEESLLTLRESGVNLWVAENLEALAEVAGDRGDTERTARLWGAAEVLRETMGNPWMYDERALHEPRLAEARSRLGGPGWEEAWREGWAMTIEEAVSYALGEGTEKRGIA